MKPLSLKEILLIFSTSFFLSCVNQLPDKKISSHDVFIRYNTNGLSPGDIVTNPRSLSECRDHIEKILCLSIDPPREGNTNAPPINPCQDGSDKYLKVFQSHFDRSPDLIKKMYCYLDTIWIEPSLSSAAYATIQYGPGNKIISGAIGIRREILDSSKSFDDLLSWKEETNFGGSRSPTNPQLGVATYESNRSTHDFFIDYIISHEFGHLFDFTNNLNHSTRHQTNTGPNPVGNWKSLSWQSDGSQPLTKVDFPLRELICFYSCQGKYIPQLQAQTIYRGLILSNFASAYSVLNPFEDFAETFSLYLAHELWGLQYSILINGHSFDLSQHFNSKLMQPKRDYVRKFLMTQFRYPGE